MDSACIKDALLRAVAIQGDLVDSTLKEFASNKFKCIGLVGEEGQRLSGSLARALSQISQALLRMDLSPPSPQNPERKADQLLRLRSRANGSLLTKVASTNQQLAVSMRGLVRNSKTPGQNCPNQPSFAEFKINSPAAKRVFVLCSQGNGLCRSDLGSDSHPSPTEGTTENVNPQPTKLLALQQKAVRSLHGFSRRGCGVSQQSLTELPALCERLVML